VTGADYLPEWYAFPLMPPYAASPTPTWDANDASRNSALTAGTVHDDAVAALRRLREENGGGLRGLVIGALEVYESIDYITSADKGRLLDCFAAFQIAAGSRVDRASASQRIQALLADATADAYTKPLTLAVLAIAASNAEAMSVTDTISSPGHAAAVGASDWAGALLGGAAGPIGAYAGSVAASDVAEHTHVDITWH
jgi:hypothetical protein